MVQDAVRVGTRAPDFSLPCTRVRGSSRERAALADYQNRWLILLFYPRDFSLVCPTELTALSARLEEFDRRDCDLLGISVDALATHEQWLALPLSQGGLGGLNFPLASDEDGAAAKAYGVYLLRQHMALRGLFIIDPNGVLQYLVVHNLSVGRRTEEVLRVLDGLQTGGLCPENWVPGQPTLDPQRTLGLNSVVGHYRIEAQVGAGSYGTVFRATDLTLERNVALKILRSDGSAQLGDLLAEARAAAALNHPNVCTIHAVESQEGLPMIVMEYLDGQPLSKLLESGPLPPAVAAAIGAQIARGMAAAHAQGIVHGDLKPANIMVKPAATAKIMDFGTARRKWLDPSAAQTLAAGDRAAQSLSGTPAYMSPEQIRGGPASPASDVFALGLILYEMLIGRRVIDAVHLLDALRQIDEVNPDQLAPQVPEPFAAILRGALVADPRERLLTSAQIAEQLQATPS